MNRANLEQIFGRYVKRFPELNTGGHDEVYKWEIAAQFRPMIDRALAADDTSFPKRLVDVVQLTEQTIDNRFPSMRCRTMPSVSRRRCVKRFVTCWSRTAATCR